MTFPPKKDEKPILRRQEQTDENDTPNITLEM